MKKTNNIRGYMLAILGGVSWGISGVCGQYLFMKYEISADWLTTVRMLLSGIFLLMLALRKEHMRVFKIWKERKDVIWLIAFGLAGLLLCQYTFLAAIKYSNSATATVLQSLNVVLMAIVMSVWNRKRMSRIQIAAIILADKDADIVRQRLQEKKENGELFTEEVIKNIIEEFSLSDEEAENI